MGALFDRVCSLTALTDAWKRVRTKKAGGGIDGISVEDYESNLTQNLHQLADSLKNQKYIPEPLKRIKALKHDGTRETRPLSLPSIQDKIVQHAVRSVMEPIYNPIFLDCSYAYRPGKGPQKAYKRINHYLNYCKKRWAAIADFDRFFDTIDQNILLAEVQKKIPDPDIIRLIRMWTKAGFVNMRRQYFDITEGVGQGSVISPILSNIYAHPLDDYMIRKGHLYIRYSDNMLVLGNSRKEAKNGLEDIRFFSDQMLRLKLNNQHKPIRSLNQGFVFLGIFYKNMTRAISNGKVAKIRQKIYQVTERFGKKPEKLMEKLNFSLRGIRRYYGILDAEFQMVEIDRFVIDKLTPVLSGYVKKKVFPDVKSLLMFLDPLEFLSEAYQTNKNENLKEIAGAALKSALAVPKQAKKVPLQTKTIADSVKSADRATSRRKRKYLKTRGLSSELVVSTYGAFIGKRANRIVVSSKGKKLADIPADQIKNIIITVKGVTLSSDLIYECSKKRISTFFLEDDGPPYAMIHGAFHPHASIGLEQLNAIKNGKGISIARRVVFGKLRNQLNLMKFYGRSRKKDQQFQQTLSRLDKKIDELIEEGRKIEEDLSRTIIRDRLFSIEGRGAAAYWDLVRILLEDDIAFAGRVRKGAKDLINSLLNYGYAILYAKIWKAVTLAGLNPYLSFLHEPQPGKPSLVFDMIEEFRAQAVDRAVFTMITRNEALHIDPKTGLLKEKTKQKLIENVMERLASIVPYRRKKFTLDEVIRLQQRHLAECITSDKAYKPFVGRY